MRRGRTSRRRALTLIEVVAAVALLTLLAATGMSLLRDARASMERPANDAVIFDLQVFADAIVENPEWFGIQEELHELPDRDTVLSWPKREELLRRPLGLLEVRVRLVKPREAPAEHAWLVVHAGSSDKRSVSRLVPLPSPQRGAR